MDKEKEIIENHMDEIIDDMFKRCDLSVDESSKPIYFGFEIEQPDDILYIIEGRGEIGGDWYDSGDGYNTPLDPYVVNGRGEVHEIKITKMNNDTGEESQVDSSIEEWLRIHLDDELMKYMRDYR